MNGTVFSVVRRFAAPTPAAGFRYYCAPPPSPASSSNNKLFVGGLSWSVDERSLTDAFSSFGDVTEVRIMYDKNTGRSRGFGFVYFSKGDDARCAKDAMDGKAFLGRPLRISFALDKETERRARITPLGPQRQICGTQKPLVPDSFHFSQV